MGDFVATALVAIMFGMPLLIGVRVMAAGYRRTFVWKLGGFLSAPVLFFVVCHIVFMTAAGRSSEAGQRVCGAFGAFAVVLTAMGSTVQGAAALTASTFITSRETRRIATSKEHH